MYPCGTPFELPIIGIIKAVVIDPGINNKPASVAVQPKMDCVYILLM
jgi:hypothetical protein